MRRDENGVAVPFKTSYLPWETKKSYMTDIRDFYGGHVTYGAIDEDAEFAVHAANYHARLCDIVRRLHEWDIKHPKGRIYPQSVENEFHGITRDAAALWAEMTQEGGEK